MSLPDYMGAHEELVIEWRRIKRRLDTLYAAQAAGDRTLLTRQKVERLEALQAALLGNPEAMAE